MPGKDDLANTKRSAFLPNGVTKHLGGILLLPLLCVIVVTIACESEAESTKPAVEKINSGNPTQTQEATLAPSTLGLAIVIAQNVNLRSGPGTNYEIVGYAKKGAGFSVYGQNEDGSWLQLDVNGTTWIKASLVELTQDVTILPSVTARSETGLLPGLQSADIIAELESRGFKCEPVSPPTTDSPYYYWTCSLIGPDYYTAVEIFAKSLVDIDLIEAGVMQTGFPDNSYVFDFLSFIATLPYDGAEPDKARTWLEETLPKIKQKGDIREASFGGITFSLYGGPAAWFLNVGDELP